MDNSARNNTKGEQSMSQALNLGTYSAQVLTAELESIRDSLRDTFALAVMVPSGDAGAAQQLRYQRIEQAGNTSLQMQNMLHIMFPDAQARTVGFQMVLSFAHEMAENARLDVERELTHALADGDYVNRVGDAVSKAKQTVRSCTDVAGRLQSLDGSNASGRGVFLRDQDYEVSHYSSRLEELDVLHKRKTQLLTARDNVQSDMSGMLNRAHMNMRAVPSHEMNDIQTQLTVISKQLDLVNEAIAPGTAAARGRYSELKIPNNMNDKLKGNELIQNMDGFMDKNKHHFPVVSVYTRRVGHNINPARGVFHQPPTLEEGYATVPESMREAYKAESAKLWTEFATRVPAGILRDIQRSFNYGRDNDLVAVCKPGDGVMAYWSMLAMYRPMDSTYHDDVENWLDSCYWKVNRYNGTIIDVLKEIKLRIDEAKLLGIRVKWHKTGKRWISLLEKRANFAVALAPFKKKVPDTDDCVLVLSDLVLCMQQVASDEFTAPATNSPFYHEQGMLADDCPYRTEGEGDVQADPAHPGAYDLLSQADAWAMLGYTRGGPTTNPTGREFSKRRRNDDEAGALPGRRLDMAKGHFGGSPVRQPTQAFQRRGSPFGNNRQAQQRAYGAEDRNNVKNDSARCCFKDTCPGPRKAHFELCTTCHKSAIQSGTFKGKDGVTYPMLQISSSTSEQRRANTMKMVKAATAWRRGPAAQLASAHMADQQEDQQTMLQDEIEYENCMRDMGVADDAFEESAEFIMGTPAGMVSAGVPLADHNMHLMQDGAPVVDAVPQEQQAMASQILQLQRQEAARIEALRNQQ